MGLHLAGQGSGVVAAGLGKAHAAADGADILVLDPDAHRLQATLIVSAGGREDDHEQECLRHIHAQERLGGDDEGADIEGGARLGGDPVLVHGDDGLHGLHEVLHGDLGDAQTVVGVVGPLGVHVGAEEIVGAVGGLVSLQAFKHLLAIVEHHAGGGQSQVVERLDAGVVPALPSGIVHQEHVVREDLAEAQLAGGLGLGGCGLGDLDV